MLTTLYNERLYVPGTKFVLELVDDGSAQPGTPVMIGLRMLSLNQAWRLDRVERRFSGMCESGTRSVE